MKYIFLLLFIATAERGIAQQNPSGQFVLHGKILNQQDGLVYLSYSNAKGERVRDSVELKNGAFEFKGRIKEPSIASFWGNIKSRNVDDPNYTTIFLEPSSMKLTATDGQFKIAQITGSKSQSEYQIIQLQLEKIRSRWKVVMDTLSAANKRSNFEYQALRDWVLEPYFAEVREVDLNFFDKHPTSYVTAYRLRFMLTGLTTDSIKMFYARFSQKVKESEYGKYVTAELDKRKLGVIGSMAKDFTTTDIESNKLSLSDFKGKYVLLDFWASWCLPCRKLNPHLKELYATYKDKGFEVIGVSDDDRNPDAWKKAVVEDALPWKHILRGAKMVNGRPDLSADISAGFNISSLPTHVLIDPNGKIIGRYGGEGGEDHASLDKKLESVLK
jgi:thiol-disulfide isomerase/thioredoxin